MGKTAAARVITVEYLEPYMSRQLLCKFPDNSAFDFDYSQSGIWSPLVPCGGGGAAFVSCPFRGVAGGGRRLFSEGYNERVSSQEKGKGKKLKKLGRKIRKKVARKGGAAKKGLGLSADFSASPTPKKGWGKVLKAATRRFIKQKRSPLQLMLPTL